MTKDSLTGLRFELNVLKSALANLQRKVSDLERRISGVQGQTPETFVPPPQPGAIASDQSPVASAVPAQSEPSVPESGKQEGLEVAFGKYWLNRIGVAVFFLGMAFFVSYAFQYLNALAKIAIGYAFTAGFFFWGKKLETRERYRRLSWGILGGGWALLYLTTYALHYIEETRLIGNPSVELILLSIVSFYAILHNLRYRSWVTLSLATLLSFVTLCLGTIEYSTIIYCALLTGVAAYISVKLHWHKYLIFVMSGSYLTYALGLKPHLFTSFLVTSRFTIPVLQFQLGFGILLLSWLIYAIALLRLPGEQEEQDRYLAVGVSLNAFFFCFLGLGELYGVRTHLHLAGDIRLLFLAGLAASSLLFAYLNKRLGKGAQIAVHVIVAFCALFIAIMIRSPQLSIGFFWALQMLCLFLLGLYYRVPSYRIFGLVLAGFLFARFLFVDLFSGAQYSIFALQVRHVFLMGVLTAFCYFAVGTAASGQDIQGRVRGQEVPFYRLLIVLGTVILLLLIERESARQWVTLTAAGMGTILLGVGISRRLAIYRLCALGVFIVACARLLMVDLGGLNTVYRIAAFCAIGLILLGASLAYSKFVTNKAQP